MEADERFLQQRKKERRKKERLTETISTPDRTYFILLESVFTRSYVVNTGRKHRLDFAETVSPLQTIAQPNRNPGGGFWGGEGMREA